MGASAQPDSRLHTIPGLRLLRICRPLAFVAHAASRVRPSSRRVEHSDDAANNAVSLPMKADLTEPSDDVRANATYKESHQPE